MFAAVRKLLSSFLAIATALATIIGIWNPSIEKYVPKDIVIESALSIDMTHTG